MSAAGPLVPVQLLGLPVEIHRQSGEHQEALRREMAFIEHAQSADAAPARLQALTKELLGKYGSLTETQGRLLRDAAAAGRATVDVTFELPAEIVDATIQLGALLEELDDFCREGDLLTLVTPPLLLAYRRWVLGELIGQIRDGRPPQPWTSPTTDDPVSAEVSARDATEAARVVVDDDLDLATSPALRQVLVDHIDRGITCITVDLSACEFLDSTGLSLLVTTHHRLVELGGGLSIAGARDQVRGALDISGTTDFFGQA
jgi:anti-sigma B factor antagonist